MSVELTIQDGNPWWLSPNIWTVPGDDPEGTPGPPIVGVTTYLWANVRNNGSTAVTNAPVRFYWANPSVGFDRTTANHIGDAFVSLNSGQSQDVLCLTPWIPSFINGGHECVLAEAFHPSDPLPAGPDFNVPSDRHVAQRNLDVVLAAKAHFQAQFEIHNASRSANVFRIQVEEGSLEELKPLVRNYGNLLKQLKPGKLVKWHFSESRDTCSESESKENGYSADAVKLAPGQRKGLTLAGEVSGGGALIHIRQIKEKREVGGLSVLVINR